MAEGDYAVHYSRFYENTAQAPYCSVFPSLDDAEAYARQRVEVHPELRCTVYDARGFVGAPLRDIRGEEYKDKSGLSSRFRRLVGSTLFFGGLGLFVFDWSVDFQYLWPSMLGSRMLIPGALLLFTEAMVLLYAHQQKRHQH